MLDIGKSGNAYTIYTKDELLLTAEGKPFIHTEPRILKLIITDLLIDPSDARLVSPKRFLEFKIDRLESGQDPILMDFDSITDQDAFIALKTGRRKSFHGDAKVETEEFDEVKLSLTFWSSSSIIFSLNDFISEKMQLIEQEIDEDHPFLTLLKQSYVGLPLEKKAVVNCLIRAHDSGLVLPLLLVLGRITASEYAKAMVSQSGSGIDKQQGVLIESHNHYFIDACVSVDFLSNTVKPRSDEISLDALILLGESEDLEFKSTFRWDIKAGKTKN